MVDRLEGPGRFSTSRANGGARAQWGTPVNIEFARYTIAALRELDRATGGLVGWREAGYLFMAGREPAEAALRAGFEVQRSVGLDVEWLEPADVLELAPFVRAEGLRAGRWRAADGLIDPGGVALALWQEGRRLGVEYLFDTEVAAVAPGTVRLAEGEIAARYVVNAAGGYAARVAATAGVDLPVEPYRRNLAVTEPVPPAVVPELIPMCVDFDTGFLIRREGAGIMLSYSNPADPPSFETAFDRQFLDDVAERAGNRFPFLESVGVDERKCWAGLYPETPDHHAIVDTAPGQDRFIQCVGFGGHGIMHSLAAGQAVTELVRDGRCTSFDLRPLRFTRFAEGDVTVETGVL